MNKNIKQIENSSFDYIKYDDLSISSQSEFKKKCEDLESNIKMLRSVRARNIALNKLEECYMWIGKAIRDDQISRNCQFELQEERRDI